MGMRFYVIALVAGTLIAAGCTQVGPDFEQPDAEVNVAWELFESERIKPELQQTAEWRKAFDDEALDALIDTAYAENLAPEDVYTGRGQTVLNRRQRIKQKTLAERRHLYYQGKAA